MIGSGNPEEESVSNSQLAQLWNRRQQMVVAVLANQHIR